MTDFTDNYKDLLIKQYWEQPKAVAEIESKAALYERIFDVLQAFSTEFDLDVATGDRLDKIGKIVGITREDLEPYFEKFFGFDDNPTSLPFGSKFDPGVVGGKFYSKFYSSTIPGILSDDEFRFYIRAKIAINTTSGYLVSDDYVSIQDVIQYLFDGYGIVLDNKTMSLVLQVEDSIPRGRVYLARDLNLLPRPQAVEYNTLLLAGYDYFGFDDDPDALGFGDAFDPDIGGILAEILQ